MSTYLLLFKMKELSSLKAKICFKLPWGNSFPPPSLNLKL